MALIRNIVIAVTTISLLTFVALFGQLPALRQTPIGWLYRLLRIHIPNALSNLDRRVTGGKISDAGKRLGDYLVYRKNPVVLVCGYIIFLVLLTGCASFFLWFATPKLPTRLLIPVPLLLVQPYMFTWLCARHKGHHIIPSNHQARLRDYPYDHVLFEPGNTCSTCQLIKPARSKHCSLCGVCISMCDHHCPWINNCVGRGNYRYFMALLLTLGLVELYGAYLSWWILRPYLRLNPTHSIFSRARIIDVFIYAMNVGGLSIAGVGMLCAATGFLPLGLLAYHCYLIWAGMTTNESSKWADWRDDIDDGLVFKAHRKELDTHRVLRKYGDHNAQHSNGTAIASWASRNEIEPKIAWPVYSEQVLLCTENGQPPIGEEALWERIWSLSDVDNIYDLGGWKNFAEILKGR